MIILYERIGENTVPITVVGDFSQSIYEFQGATPDLFTNLHKFIDAETVTLKMNYRSVAQLVDMASQFRMIFKDTIPDVEGMTPSRPPKKGCLVIQEFDNSFQEYAYIADEILKQHNVCGRDFSDIAVLSRTNKNLVNIEAVCLKNKIPYKIKYDSQSLLRRSPFKFIYSILSMAVNPLDVISMVDILSLFKGFGKVACEKYSTAINNMLMTMRYQHIYDMADISVDRDKKYTLFRAICEYLVKPVTELFQKKAGPEQILRSISGHMNQHFVFNNAESYIEDAKGFIDMEYEDFVNVLSILASTVQSSMEDPVFASKSPEQQTMDIYESLQLSRDSDDSETKKSAVVLSTTHSFKGLEAPVIFLANVHSLMTQDITNQQERCIWYVSVTRAKEMMYITGSRRVPGYNNELKLSKNNPFLDYYIRGLSLIRAKYS